MCNVEYPPTHLHFGYRCQHKQLSATRASLRLTSWKLIRLFPSPTRGEHFKIMWIFVDSCNGHRNLWFQYYVNICWFMWQNYSSIWLELCVQENPISMHPSDLIARDLRLLQITRSCFKPKKTHVTKFLDSLCKQTCPEVSFIVRVKKGKLPGQKQWKIHFV